MGYHEKSQVVLPEIPVKAVCSRQVKNSFHLLMKHMNAYRMVEIWLRQHHGQVMHLHKNAVFRKICIENKLVNFLIHEIPLSRIRHKEAQGH